MTSTECVAHVGEPHEDLVTVVASRAYYDADSLTGVSLCCRV